MSVSMPMRKPSRIPCFTQALTSQSPALVFSAARISPRLSAALNSAKSVRSSGVYSFPARAQTVSSCSRSSMRGSFQEAELKQHFAHARTALILNRDQRQAKVLFNQTHHRQRSLDG